MLLQTKDCAFDDENYIFELKLDGFRCLAYCDKKKTILKSRNGKNLGEVFDELTKLHMQCKENCVLDGEIVYVDENGCPNFEILQKRMRYKGKNSSYQVCFFVFDILYYKNKDITKKTLMERKQILKNVIVENDYLKINSYIEKNGIELFRKVRELSLEGIVAKQKNSIYEIGKRSYSWLKIKNYILQDFFVCGFSTSGNEVRNLFLATFDGKKLVYDGKIFIQPKKNEQEFILKFAKNNTLKKPLFENLKEEITWIEPKIICTVRFFKRTKNNKRRHAVFVKLK